MMMMMFFYDQLADQSVLWNVKIMWANFTVEC